MPDGTNTASSRWPRVFDSCMFDGELDMLELRLRTMDWCDGHILVEAGELHRGGTKPFYYKENQERFAPWAHKITYVQLPHLEGDDPWSRLKWQHDQVAQGSYALDTSPGDWLLICDVDEILPAEAMLALRANEETGLVGFRPRIMMYAVDWEYPGRYEGLPEPRAIKLSRLEGRTVTEVRDAAWPMLEAAMGFHFTWLGGVEAQTAKLGRIAHTEITPQQAERVTSGRAYRDGTHFSGLQLKAVDVDEDWPYWIQARRCPPSWFRPR